MGTTAVIAKTVKEEPVKLLMRPEFYISIMREASDRYGNPHLIGFLVEHDISGFIEAKPYELHEYCEREGLLDDRKGP